MGRISRSENAIFNFSVKSIETLLTNFQAGFRGRSSSLSRASIVTFWRFRKVQNFWFPRNSTKNVLHLLRFFPYAVNFTLPGCKKWPSGTALLSRENSLSGTSEQGFAKKFFRFDQKSAPPEIKIRGKKLYENAKTWNSSSQTKITWAHKNLHFVLVFTWYFPSGIRDGPCPVLGSLKGSCRMSGNCIFI